MPASAPPASLLAAPPLLRRMGAWLYDGLLAAAIALVASIPMTLLHPWTGGAEPFATRAVLFLVLGLYFSWSWSRGQTLAMKTWRIRLVDRHGQPLRQAHALLRYALCWVWLLPPLAAMAYLKLPVSQMAAPAIGWIVLWALASRLHPQRQFWHDAWAGTRLIDTRPAQQR